MVSGHLMGLAGDTHRGVRMLLRCCGKNGREWGKHGEVMGSPSPRRLPQAVGEPDRMVETQLEEQQCGK